MFQLVHLRVPNIMLVPTPKAMTEAASSIPATAMINVGIPLATPYPFDLNRNRDGTTMAGDTAANIDLRIPIIMIWFQ